MKKIENWFVSWEKKDGYTAPEMRRKAIIGQVEDAPPGHDLQIILTARVQIDGRIITTSDGDKYELGQPEPGYLEWLCASGIEYDEAQPVKLVMKLRYGGLDGKRPPNGGRGPGSN